MKKLLLVLFVLVTAISLTSCGKKKEEVKKEKKLHLVKVTEIQGTSFTEKFKVSGVLKPYESAKLSSEEGGIIISLSKDKGSRVGRGEVIARLLKDGDYAVYEQSLAQYNLAKENYDRTERLYIDGVATEQQFTASKLQLDIAEKSVKIYETRLRKAVVTSPISGIVDAKFMNRGEMSSPGAPILSIINVSKVKVSVGIPERYVNEIVKGQRVKVNVDVFPDDEFYGTISYIAPALNPSTRTFEIEVVVSNPNGKLKPEMAASMEFTKKELNDVVVLSQDMIIDNVEEQFVFVLEGDIARKRIIKLGGRRDNNVLIDDGLMTGEKFISEGFQFLADGDKVQVVN
jgi:RND family efflux transporter MFP subunit